jgi:predicted site-specific integrase-resolvase
MITMMRNVFIRPMNIDKLPRKANQSRWARILGISPLTLRKYEDKGILPYTLHINGYWKLYTKEDILNLLEYLKSR